MFDIVITAAPATPFTARVASALREARMRVITCEVGPHRPPPDALRVDAAVACAPTAHGVLDLARSVRAVLDGPPPVVGVGGDTALPASELSHSLPGDASDAQLVAHVQRAAAQAERRRSRIVLRGDLDDVGLEGLLASLASRAKSCFVRVRTASRRAEITLEAGRPVHVRVDGLDASKDRAGALASLGEWRGANFEVVAIDEASVPRSQRPTSRPPAFSSGDATDVALAAAIVNACAAYARTWLGPTRTADLLATAWTRARMAHPGLDAFAISSDGMVSVAQVDRARAAIPAAVAEWILGFFDAAALVSPARFRRVRLREILGGLMKLVEQVGWASALFEAEGARS